MIIQLIIISILSIVDNYSKKFTTNSSDRLGTYDLETTGGTEINNWNSSLTRKLVWTPTTSGTYYYYSWDGSDNSTKNYGGIIIVYDNEPVLKDIICSSNNKNTITNEALSNGNKVVVSSSQSKQHDYSLYFNKSKLSMSLPNNMKGFNSDINSIQFYAYINNNSDTNSVLFSQGQDVLLEVEKTTIDLANDLPNEANNIGQYDLNVQSIIPTNNNVPSNTSYYSGSIKAYKTFSYGYWLSAGTATDAFAFSSTTLTEAPADEAAYLTDNGNAWDPNHSSSQPKVPNMPNPLNIKTIFMVFSIDEYKSSHQTIFSSAVNLKSPDNTPQQPEGHYQYYILQFVKEGDNIVKLWSRINLQYQTINGVSFTGEDPTAERQLVDPNNERKGYLVYENYSPHDPNLYQPIMHHSHTNGKLILAIQANEDSHSINDYWTTSNEGAEYRRNTWKDSNPLQSVSLFQHPAAVYGTPGSPDGPLETNLYEFISYNERLSSTEINDTIKYLNKKWSAYETSTDDITPSYGSGNYSINGATTLPKTTNRVSHFDGTLPNNVPSSSSLKLTHNSNEIVLNTPTINFNEWIHFAYTRYYNMINLYINGQRYSAVSDNNLSVSNTNTLYLGYGAHSGALQSITNKADNSTINLLGSGTSTIETDTINGTTHNFFRLYNYIKIDTTAAEFKTIFAVFKHPPLSDLQSAPNQSWFGNTQKMIYEFAYVNPITQQAGRSPTSTYIFHLQERNDGSVGVQTDTYNKLTYRLVNGVEVTNTGNDHITVVPDTLCLLAIKMTNEDFRHFMVNASWPVRDGTVPDITVESNFTSYRFDLYELLAYSSNMSTSNMAGVIMHLNKKYRVYTTANMVNEHIYNASGTDYSPNGATHLPHTTNLVLHINGSSDTSNESVDAHYNGYMDNIEVYDNTLLYDDVINVKYLNNNLYTNNKIGDTNLFNNKHLLFNFGNTNTKTLFEGNSNIGLSQLSSNSYISYNLPLQNDTQLRYINSNDNVVSNISPFKKYVVTEINNQYYIDGIGNKFIELVKNDTIIFDLTALADKTKFEIVNNHFTSVAINTNDDTNFVFTYAGTENTLYYVKTNYKSKDTLNFGNGSTPNINTNTIYHCFTGFIYDVPDNVTIIYEPSSNK